ncbi:hypothetical protein [Motilimonas pumila]|uniref:Lipoprotein n=1 Tax=Motilimonas pumila TaxID=2303987 RepID=A0A418YD79_9GAMM|nr:hypothetical protein [Motilimonas pumila]RJG42474.1 hypothetical protein D1Z90_13460 [Motilimonas pumila]
MTSFTYLALFLMTLISLSACGGGGGGSNPDDVSNANEIAEELPTVTTAPTDDIVNDSATDIQDLIVNEDFNFTAITEKNITLRYTDLEGTRAYVSVYSEFTELSTGDFIPVASSRLVSGPLINGQFSAVMSALPEQHYLVEVWQYQGQTPLQHLISGEDLNYQQ